MVIGQPMITSSRTRSTAATISKHEFARCVVVGLIAACIYFCVIISYCKGEASDNKGTLPELAFDKPIKVEVVTKSGDTKDDLVVSLLKNTLFQGIILLCLGAVVTGLGVPAIKSKMDLKYFKLQKKHEADVARQAKIVEQQTQFLKDFSQILWKFHFLVSKVTYEHANGVDAASASKIWEMYNSDSWVVLQEMRQAISLSSPFVSNSKYAELIKIFDRFVKIDIDLVERVNKHQIAPFNKRNWTDYNNKFFYQESAKIDGEIKALASDLGLNVQEAMRGTMV